MLRLNGVSRLLAGSSLAVAAACADYGDYGHEGARDVTEAGGGGTDASSGGRGGSSGTGDRDAEADTGPRNDAGSTGTGGYDAEADTGPRSDAGSGGSGGFNGAGGRDAETDTGPRSDAGDTARDGSASETSSPSPNIAVTFDQGSDLYLFDFVTPETNAGVSGIWAWSPDTPTTSASLLEATDYAVTTGNLGGTYAVYRGRTFVEGTISVDLWSSDSDTGGIMFGYIDEWRQYRFAMSATATYLGQGIDSITGTFLQEHQWCGGIKCESLADVHHLRLSIRGREVRGYVNDILYLRYVLPGSVSGGFGLWTRALHDAHFDNFTVDFTPPVFEPTDGGGSDAGL